MAEDSIGWRAGLSDDLKGNEAFTPFKTVSDFAKVHLETAARVTDLEGKLKEAIPKLPDDATQEERDIYQISLGRPEKGEEYEFDGVDNSKPELTADWRSEFLKQGLSKQQAKGLSAFYNAKLNKLVDDHKASIQAEIAEASTKLKTEWGDKYDTNVELAKRLWKTHTDGDFDKAFTGETSANRFQIMRYVLKMAAKTGEDSSAAGGSPRAQAAAAGRMNYEKSNMPPARA